MPVRRLRLLRHRLRAILRPRQVQEELDRELQLHLEQLTRESLAAGLDETVARRATRRAFGSLDLVREQCRDTRRVGLVEDLVRDVRYGVRLLGRAPMFTATAVLSLAIGLGVTTGIFSIADVVLWRLLPVSHPEQLVFLKTAGTAEVGGAPPYPVFRQMRIDSAAFTGMAAFASDDLRIDIDGQLEQVHGQLASGNYFDLLGVAPMAGRLTTQADEDALQPVAVVSHGFAQRRFGGPRHAIGRTIGFPDTRFTIVGVTPPGFVGLQPGRVVDITLPIVFERDALESTETWWFEVVARLAPDTTTAAATAQVDAIFQTFMNGVDAASSTASMRRSHFDHLTLVPAAQGLDQLRGRFSTPLHILILVSGAVLLITCLNLGNLLLVRGATRERELAIRVAAGAGDGRLCRQLLTETLLLFVAGGALGMVVASMVVAVLTGYFAIGRSPILVDVSWDWRLGAFAAGITLVAGLLTGLWPALRLLRSDRGSALSGHGVRLAGSARISRVARWSVASQVALSLVLVVAATMAMQTMANLRAVPLGFQPAQILTMSLDPLNLVASDTNDEARASFWRESLRRIRALPGVDAASLSVLTPLSGRDRGRFVRVAGFDPQTTDDRLIRVNLVSDGYFETFGVERRQGRVLTAADTQTAMVAVVNEAAVAKYFGGRGALGETLDIGEFGAYQIVGVVADHTHRSLRETAPPMAFISLWRMAESPARITLAVGSALPAAAVARAVADQVRSVHSQTLISDVLAVDEQIDATLVVERILTTLATGVAVLAVGMAMLGLHGVLSATVARRRTEFGVRMALGASRGHVAWSVYREVIWQVAAGLVGGVPVALALTPYGANLLYGVRPADPSTILLSIVVLALVAAVAAGLPVRRALSIPPSEALREG